MERYGALPASSATTSSIEVRIDRARRVFNHRELILILQTTELEKKGNKTARGVEAATEPTSATLEAGGSAAGCAAGASEPTSPVYAQNDPFDQRPGTAASQSQAADLVPSAGTIAVPSGATGLQRDIERALIGSLTTSYKFKKGGLVKKTISNGSLHLM